MDRSPASTMVDVAFALAGRRLPRAHGRALAAALVDRLPWLADDPLAGVHAVNVAAGDEPAALLSGRSRLKLRVARSRVQALQALAGAALEVGGEAVTVGAAAQVAELRPHPTLYARVVHGAGADEAAFVADATRALAALGVVGRVICGRAQADDAGEPLGYSLMVDQLDADDALRLLQQGLGPHRLWGCGLFVGHKTSAAVGA